jgi:hypothetical protein
VLLFAVGAGIVGGLARRRIIREIFFAGIIISLVQLFFWILQSDGGFKMALTSPVYIESTTSLTVMPPSLMFVMVAILCLLVGMAFASVGKMVGQQITGQMVCYSCDRVFPIQAKGPRKCPSCGTSELESRINWSWVGLGVTSTICLFYIFIRFLGAPLGFYWMCDYANPSESCREGHAVLEKAEIEQSSSVYHWRKMDPDEDKKGEGVIIHSWKYMLFPSVIFFIAPFLMALLSRKSNLMTPGMAVFLNWIGATFVAFLFLGFAKFEGVFMVSMRLHLLAVFPWCIAGLVGALLGQRLSSRRVVLEEEKD